jgi:hypothetical protein
MNEPTLEIDLNDPDIEKLIDWLVRYCERKLEEESTFEGGVETA